MELPKEINFKFLYAILKKLKTTNFFQNRISVVFKKGQVIGHTESIKDKIFFIKKGSVQIYTTTPGGKRKILGVYNEGAVFDNSGSGNQFIYGTAAALMDSELLCISREFLIEIMNNTPLI
jgi:CRP-like cAMP-binding protein